MKHLIITLIFISNVTLGISQGSLEHVLSIEENGLLSDDNYRVCQDRQGYIWIASKNGLIKYDGIRSKSFTKNNGLPTNDIWFLRGGSQDRIWIYSFIKGTYYIRNNEVNLLKGSEKIQNVFYTGEENDTVFFSSFAPDNLVSSERYFLKGNSLVRFNNRQLPSTESELCRNKTFFITQSRTKTNLRYLRDRKTGKLVSVIDGFVVNGLYEDNKELIFTEVDVNTNTIKATIVSNSGVKKVDLNKYLGVKVKSVRIIDTGGFLVFTENGINVYKSLYSKERMFSCEVKLNNFLQYKHSPFHLYIDYESNYWLTFERGKVHFIPNYASDFLKYKDNSGNFVLEVLPVQNGYFVHQSSREKTMCYFQDSQFKDKRVLLNFPLAAVYQWNKKVVCLDYGNKLIVFDGNLNKMRTLQLHPANSVPGSKRNLCIGFVNDSILVDALGYFFKWSKNRLIRLPKKMNFHDDRVRIIQPFGDNLLWYGSSGLHLWDGRNHLLDQVQVYKMKKWKHFILICTNGNGVLLFNTKTKKIEQRYLNGYIVNDISCTNNSFYCATSKGLCVFNITLNNQTISFSATLCLNEYNGLSSREISHVISEKSGIALWNIYGVDFLNYQQVTSTNKMKPHIKLAHVKQFGTDLLQTNKRNLEPGNGDLEFQFDCLSFSSLKNRFFTINVHSDNGFEGKYHPVDGILQLKNLQPGNYTVKARVCNHLGNFSRDIVFQFVVDKWFYQTLWFRTIVVVLIFALLWLFYKAQIKKQVLKAEEKQRVSALQLQTLRSQLNPHFVFNALNSIQHAIFLKGERETNEYINAFSRLIRSALYNSHNDTITLEDEIKFLENYLQLEKWRTDDQINYEIEVAENLVPSKLKMINMTLQPILENSIIHGLLPKKTADKKISVRFELDQNVLICTVTDNGIGRIASAQLHLEKEKYYKSLSSTILKERLAILESTKRMFIEYETIDLFDDQNVSTGTKVVLKINVNYEN